MNIFKKFKNHLENRYKKRIEYRKAKFTINQAKQEAKLKFKENFSKLTIQEKLNFQKLMSSHKAIKKAGFFQKIKSKMTGTILIKVRMRYPDGIDIIRYYPMIKPYVLEINKDYYQFSPKSFRYENNEMFLEFHYSNPFAIIYTPSQEKSDTFKPTFDAHSFKNIMQSKIIEDMLYQEDKEVSWIMWAVIGLCILNFIIGLYNSYAITALKKALTGK